MRKHLLPALGLLLVGGAAWAQQYLITTVAGGGLPPTPIPALMASFPGPSAVAADGSGNIYFSSTNGVFKVDPAGVLTRVAGGPTRGYSGDGGPATSAQLATPPGVASDAAGNLYVADMGNHAIRKVAAATGIITTAAGDGGAGYSGDGGPATSAQLNSPWGVAVDAAGNLYIADTDNNRVRKVAANGTISTVAGIGTFGYSGDGGPATNAQLSWPRGVAVDAAGNLYIVDHENNRIRKVAAATGIITTVAGNGTADYSGDGGPATSAELAFPESVTVDASGNLYIASMFSAVVRKVTAATGIITTVAGTGRSWSSGYSGDGGPAVNAQLNGPDGVALDASGNLYIADSGNNVIRKVAATTGIITTVAGNGTGYWGDGGPATTAGLNSPWGLALDAAGNLYIADTYNNRIRKVTASGNITTVAGNGTGGYSGDGGPATSASFWRPRGVAVSVGGDLYIADGANNRIRKVVAATGFVTTVAGNGRLDYSGDGDGGPATNAEIWGPYGVALDTAGNLYIAANGHNRIRKVAAATGIITTVAGNGTTGYSGDGGPAASAQLSFAEGVAVDAAGNLYIADTDNSSIRKVVAATGIITTVAGNGRFGYSGDGGPATGAQLGFPEGVAVDAAGNLYIADTSNNAVRKVAAATGIITTVAGNGWSRYPGDGGLATEAAIWQPHSVATDAAGNLYIVAENAIRLLVPQGVRALLNVAMTQSANSFGQGQTGATYSVSVSNAAGAAPTSGTVTVTEIAPTGLTVVSMAGTGWSCSANACSRSDALNPGSSYPPITITVNVASDAPSQVVNEVSVSGGGAAAISASSLATVIEPPIAPVPTSPANGASGVVLAPTLSWIAPPVAASYDVYFGTSSAPPLVTSTTGSSYAPGALVSGATYYWRIEARNAVGTASSTIWSFTTAATAPAGLRFVPVTPCRVADTRRTSSIAGNSSRDFAIPQSGCGIPPTAQAYSLNVTALPQGPLYYLTLWPTGLAQPLASTLNSWSGDVVANAAIVPAGTGGAVGVFVSNTADVILDVNGYFDTSSGTSSLDFYPAPPCRVADTRYGSGQFAGPSMISSQPRDFPVPLSPCGIPAWARGYSLNFTVVPPGYLGFLTTWPTGQTQPNASTLNSWTGKVVANAAIVPAGSNESISVYVSNPTNVILDVNGYFGAPGSAGALTFYPVTPCRVADTREATGTFGGPEMGSGVTRSFPIPASGCNIPANAAAYSLNVTVVPGGYLGYLSIWPVGGTKPNVSTLNSWDGSVVANAAIVPAGSDGAIDVYVTNPTNVILDINGYFAP